MPRPTGWLSCPKIRRPSSRARRSGFSLTQRSQSERQIRTAEVVKATLTGSAPIDEVELGSARSAHLLASRHRCSPARSRTQARPAPGCCSAPQLPAGLGIPAIEECARGRLAAGHARNQHAISDDRRAGGVVALAPVGEFLSKSACRSSYRARRDCCRSSRETACRYRSSAPPLVKAFCARGTPDSYCEFCGQPRR
jgi:hypothetical protein